MLRGGIEKGFIIVNQEELILHLVDGIGSTFFTDALIFSQHAELPVHFDVAVTRKSKAGMKRNGLTITFAAEGFGWAKKNAALSRRIDVAPWSVTWPRPTPPVNLLQDTCIRHHVLKPFAQPRIATRWWTRLSTCRTFPPPPYELLGRAWA